MRMIIVGNSGSGKTWLAKKLAKIDGSPVIHFDHIFWEPGGFDKQRPSEVVTKMIDEYKSLESWIAEGVFGELAERFIECEGHKKLMNGFNGQQIHLKSGAEVADFINLAQQKFALDRG